MMIEKRKAGTEYYYSFSYRDKNGKKIRLKKSEHPYFTIYEEARAWAKSQEAYRSAHKAVYLQKQAWKSKYYDFEALLDKYTLWQQEKAPNSWKSNIGYLQNHIFYFFLEVKHSNNVNHWHLHYQEFLDWLKVKAKGPKGNPLARATVNNIIKTLNTFIECLATYNLIDPQFKQKCKALPEHMVAKRSHKDVISEEEMYKIYDYMLSFSIPSAEFFKVLFHTGMRFSELFGLPIARAPYI